MDLEETNVRPCLMQAWEECENQLQGWLYKQTHDEALAQDILQDVFIRAMRQQQAFCDIHNAKA